MSVGQKLWKTTEVEKLKRMYPTGRVDIVANELGRSVKSVYRYAEHIGLRKEGRSGKDESEKMQAFHIRLKPCQLEKLKEMGGARAVRDWLDSLP